MPLIPVNNIIVVTDCSKWHQLSRSLVAVDGITLTDVRTSPTCSQALHFFFLSPTCSQAPHFLSTTARRRVGASFASIGLHLYTLALRCCLAETLGFLERVALVRIDPTPDRSLLVSCLGAYSADSYYKASFKASRVEHALVQGPLN